METLNKSTIPTNIHKQENSEFRVYYNTACIICLKASPDIKRCSACKTVPYCCIEHQKLDWKSHKDLCNVIKHCKLIYKGNNFDDFRHFQVALRIAWETDLKRKLHPHEEMMILHPRICVVCYSKENLYDCKTCLNVSYCCKEHEDNFEIHKKYCNDLKLGMLVDQYVKSRTVTFVEFEPVQGDFNLNHTKDIRKHLSVAEGGVRYNYLSENEVFTASEIAKTQCVFLGLNILHSLRTTNLEIKETLILHIVGASMIELLTDWIVVTKILRHSIELNTVKYYFIGPSINDNVEPHYFKEEMIHIEYRSGYYHNVVDSIPQPNLVYAFNCGLHEYTDEEFNPWKLSIPTLLKYENVPLILTSYTKNELLRDKKIILDLKYETNVILDICKNPFSSIKPLRDWSSIKEPVFYMCNYIFIIQKIS